MERILTRLKEEDSISKSPSVLLEKRKRRFKRHAKPYWLAVSLTTRLNIKQVPAAQTATNINGAPFSYKDNHLQATFPLSSRQVYLLKRASQGALFDIY